MKNKKVKELKGANMDIDLVSENVDWKQTSCPWNDEENTKEHKYAVKDMSICKYFCGIKYLDSVLCSYPYENLDVLSEEEIDRKMKEITEFLQFISNDKKDCICKK